MTQHCNLLPRELALFYQTQMPWLLQRKSTCRQTTGTTSEDDPTADDVSMTTEISPASNSYFYSTNTH